MNRRTFVKTLPAFTMLAGSASLFAEDSTAITLPQPEKEGGKSVLAALWARKTTRNLSDRKLPLQTLSNLLWAAYGVNRGNGPFDQIGRTAASASNSQEIDLYVALPEAIYLYEAIPHRLTPIATGDLRAKVYRRFHPGMAVKAPVILIFVADLAKYSKARLQEPGLKDPEVQKAYYNVATGTIAENVYLFAASQGLGAWFHNCNKTALAEVLKPRPEQRILFAQSVGYPLKS
jgi:nitroreductase